MMKRLIIIFTLLFTLFLVLTGCDNGSAPDSSSSLVKVCFTVDGDSSSIQKTASINGFDFTYQYKAVPQWTSDENIYGKTDSWTNISYSDGMSLGYFTPGKWVFYIQILNGSTVVYEGHSNVITISRSTVNITISVARIIKETTPGLSISITAPTEAGNTLTVSWGGGSDSAIVSESGGITTFTYSKDNLADGTYTITLTHSNNQIDPYIVSNVSINSTDLTLIRGHLNNGEWNVTCETLQFHRLTVERYNWNDEEHPWDASLDPKYCGTVDYIDSAVLGERVSFSPRPDPKSRVVSVSVTCGNTEVDFIKQGTLYLFIMPEGDVTIRVKFFDVDSAEVDTMLFRSLVRALYSQNDVKAFGKYDELTDYDAGNSAVTLGDVQIWYSNRTINNKTIKKICWKANNAEGKAHLTSGSLAGLFQGHSKYESISMDDIVTSEITDMSNMFQGCTGLQTLNLTGFDAHNVTDMSGMFQDCTKLTSIILTNIQTNINSGVNMAGLFKNCSKLTTLTDLSSLATNKATSLAGMFQGCTTLSSLTLSNFNASSATDISEMFQGCTALSSLTLSNFNASSVTDMSDMFRDCTNLVTLDLDGFTVNSSDDIKVDMQGLFRGCVKLRGKNNVLNLSSFNTSRVKDMSYMFCKCKALTEINLSSFNTANVEDMSYMFSSVEEGTAGGSSNKMNLTRLDVSGFRTPNVTNMSHMFYMCSNASLTTLAVSQFNTQKVTDMSYMFGCWEGAPSYVTAFNLTDWDFSNVTTVNRMFDRCEYATSITFPARTKLYRIEDMLYMFSNCYRLTRAQLKTIIAKWDFSGHNNITALRALFSNVNNNDSETSPNNRIMKNNMYYGKHHITGGADFNTRDEYPTFDTRNADPPLENNTNPITKLYVGGDIGSNIKFQRLTTDPLGYTPPNP